MKKRHHYEIEKEWITFTPGIVTALHMAVNAVTQPGDEVLITSPVYGPFFGATTDEGRTLVDAPADRRKTATTPWTSRAWKRL